MEEIHLEFMKNDEKIREELDWTPEKDNIAMVGKPKGFFQVITPGFPTQNAAKQITAPSDRIINAELGNGLAKHKSNNNKNNRC